MRRQLTVPCGDALLAATLDEGARAKGLLIVSGGNEPRIGAHRGMAQAAAAIAAQGWPVFRFDRRGIGDSTGTNGGFRSSRDDIAAAAAAFRAMAGIDRILAFGNCDAATALAMFHRAAGIDALLLANPWVVEPSDDLPPPAAIRARYVARLASPAGWRRALRDGIDLRRGLRGLRAMLAARHGPSPLMERFADGLRDGTPLRILLAERDNTAIAFADQWRRDPLSRRTPVMHCPTASHSFAGPADGAWLRARMLDALGDL